MTPGAFFEHLATHPLPEGEAWQNLLRRGVALWLADPDVFFLVRSRAWLHAKDLARADYSPGEVRYLLPGLLAWADAHHRWLGHWLRNELGLPPAADALSTISSDFSVALPQERE